MAGIVQFCRICFRNNSILRKLHEIDIDGVLLFDKLKSCVPEILYSHELEKYELICLECCNLLKTAYMFKELCIRSNILLHGCLNRGKNGLEFTECLSNNIMEQNINKTDNNETSTSSSSSSSSSSLSSNETLCSENKNNEQFESFSGNNIEDCDDISSKEMMDAFNSQHESELICFVCNIAFTDKQKFEQHILTHKTNNKHLCFHCGRSFTRKTYLKKHIFIHTGIRPFVCYMCNMTFNRKNTLETHMLIHSGIRNHKCPICGKCFRLKCALDRHLLIHSDFKAHKCTVCGKGFGRKDHLEKHIRVHRN